MTNFKFKLGAKVKDKITGFTGYVMCRSQYLTGCDVYSLIPFNKKEAFQDGKEKWKSFDATRLTFVSKGINLDSKTPGEKKSKPGGPRVFEVDGPGR